MPRNRFFHCLTLAAAFFLLWETQASAYETRVVTDHANTPLFQLRFFDQGEEYGNVLSETEGEVSTWQLSAAQKDAVTQAVELWADILRIFLFILGVLHFFGVVVCGFCGVARRGFHARNTAAGKHSGKLMRGKAHGAHKLYDLQVFRFGFLRFKPP